MIRNDGRIYEQSTSSNYLMQDYKNFHIKSTLIVSISVISAAILILKSGIQTFGIMFYVLFIISVIGFLGKADKVINVVCSNGEQLGISYL